MRKVVILALMVMLLLTGCGDGDFSFDKLDPSPDDTPADTAAPTAGPAGQVQIPMPTDEELEFELDGSEPNFEDGVTGTGSAVDLSQTPDYSSQLEDPNASTGAGSDLDSAIDQLPGDPVDTAGPAQPTEQFAKGTGDTETDLGASQEEPTEDTKYPNTGIFLEDD